MRMSVVFADNLVCVDAQCFNNLDLSFCPEGFHALQWYDTYGEVEWVTTVPNTEIKELGIYEQAYNVWKEAKRKWEVSEQERIQRELDDAKKQEEDRIRDEYIQSIQNQTVIEQDLATAESDSLLTYDPEG